MESKFNIGDIVAYQENIFEHIFLNIPIKQNPKTVKVEKYGIWNGKYTQLNDVEKTIVRNTDWLYIPESSTLEIGKFKLIKTY